MLPEAEREQVQEEFEKILLEDFQKGISAKAKEENQIVSRAESKLKALEKELLQPSQRQYYGSKTIKAKC